LIKCFLEPHSNSAYKARERRGVYPACSAVSGMMPERR